jgi:hypothetical protein
MDKIPQGINIARYKMTIRSYIDEDKDLTIFTVTGRLSFDEVMPVVKDFYDGNPTKNVLWDLTDIKEVQVTSEEVRLIVSYGPRYEGKRASAGKTAFVVQKEVLFGMSRMFEIQSNMKNVPYTIEVFRNRDEAYQWLDEP